jgi:DNA-directed RNA polymerase specialized sigma24 family protein
MIVNTHSEGSDQINVKISSKDTCVALGQVRFFLRKQDADYKKMSSVDITPAFSMLNTARFTKILALAGSYRDGEALSALRKARAMLAEAGLTFTDVAQSVGKSARHGHQTVEAEALKRLLLVAEFERDAYRNEIEECKRKLKKLEREQTQRKSLRRSMAMIEARMRAVLRDRRLKRLSDRELARRTGISPQAVGNWRRRLAAEQAALGGRVSTMDRKSQPRARAA